MGKPLTSSDIRLIGILIVATILAFPMASMAGGYGDGTASISGPHGTTIVSLENEATYVVDGRGGEVVFEVSDGSLFCIESSCDAQICVSQGEVRQGRPVVCAPNGVTALLSVSRGSVSDDELDAVSR